MKVTDDSAVYIDIYINTVAELRTYRIFVDNNIDIILFYSCSGGPCVYLWMAALGE